MDVATFTLVDTLSDDRISRLNANGTGVAQWLESECVGMKRDAS
jgi:THO complex subunit 2